MAMQQAGLGLILTALIVSAPPMAAILFQGTLGQFTPYSAFQNQPQPGAPGQPGYAGAPGGSYAPLGDFSSRTVVPHRAESSMDQRQMASQAVRRPGAGHAD